jgi:transcriptional regulator NrdR family protein
MHCPFCQHENTRVIDSRVSDDGGTIRRRRECEACGERFNTFETAEIKLPNVVKDVQAFREEIEKLERDLPSLEGLQLSLLGDAKPGQAKS